MIQGPIESEELKADDIMDCDNDERRVNVGLVIKSRITNEEENSAIEFDSNYNLDQPPQHKNPKERERQ